MLGNLSYVITKARFISPYWKKVYCILWSTINNHLRNYGSSWNVELGVYKNKMLNLEHSSVFFWKIYPKWLKHFVFEIMPGELKLHCIFNIVFNLYFIVFFRNVKWVTKVELKSQSLHLRMDYFLLYWFNSVLLSSVTYVLFRLPGIRAQC